MNCVSKLRVIFLVVCVNVSFIKKMDNWTGKYWKDSYMYKSIWADNLRNNITINVCYYV